MNKSEGKNDNLQHNCDTSDWSSIEDVSIIKNLNEPFDLEKGPNCSKLRDDKNYNEFDNNVGTTWVYPINKPIRQYQFNICKAALFRNTLVVLPTGLGKTFIAAVVMFNIYRWYPKGKIIFMAPTRPLVTQQIDACCKIMGIPKSDIAEMTGKISKINRANEWHVKRLFFATPQVVQKDLSDSTINFPFKNIKLVVVDEAHKAKGKYAYVEVIQQINEINKNFRVLALSATPGRNIMDVVEIIQNLLISTIEIRYENSIDVSPFIHKKNIKTILIPLGEKLKTIRDELIDIIDPYLRSLVEDEVISSNVSNMSKGWLIMEQKKFRERSLHQRHINHSKVTTNFSISICLYHALELLERHGTRILLNYFEDGDLEKEKFFINIDLKIKKFVQKLRQLVGGNPLIYNDNTLCNGNLPDLAVDQDFGHPKFEKARDILLHHFQEKAESKVIMFCEFREAVMLMYRILFANRPLIRPKCFVGQGGTGSIRAVTQAQQLKVMKDFREGISNTLIATSVAEEGLDVGEVDLIICFDMSTKNPTRLVQRVGRTGRMRQGQVIMLATEGKEYSTIKEVLANKDKTNLKLMKSREIKNVFYKRSPRLVPPEFDPKCIEVFVKDQNNSQNVSQNRKKTKNKKTPSKGKLSQKNDVRGYFKKIQPDLCEEEQIIFDLDNMNEVDNNSAEELISKIQKEISSVEGISTDYIVTQFENIECENKFLNASNIKELENRYKKLNHMMRHIDKDGRTPDYSKNIDELLKSKTINKLIKKYILLNNGKYVNEIIKSIEIIEIVDKEKIEINEENTESTEKKIRETFNNIETVLGDKVEIEYFVQNFEESERKKKLFKSFKERITKNINDSFARLNKRKSFESLDSIFNENFNKVDIEQLCSIDILTISNHSNNSSKNILVKDISKPNTEYNRVFENSDMLENSDCDSKYLSQWTQFNNTNIINQSTPKQKINCDISNQNTFDSSSKTFSRTALYLKDKYRQNWADQNWPVDFAINNKNQIKNIFPYALPSFECSSDLFEDDFDFALIESEHIEKQLKTLNYEKTNTKLCSGLESGKENLREINDSEIKRNNVVDHEHTKNVKTIVYEQNKYNTSDTEKEKNSMENSTMTNNIPCGNQSMISVSQILEIVAKKEPCINNLDITNPELEVFDINDFAEPFEEEEKYVSSPEVSANISDSTLCIKNKIVEPFDSKSFPQSLSTSIDDKEKISVIFNSKIIKNDNKTSTPLKTWNINDCINNKLWISPKHNKQSELQGIDKISPSLLKRATSRFKLKNASKYNMSELSRNTKANTDIEIFLKNNPENINSKNDEMNCKNDESILLIKPMRKNVQMFCSSDSESEGKLIGKEANISQLSNHEIVLTTPKRNYTKNRLRVRAQRRKRLGRCDLIDDEADHSSSDSKKDDGTSDFDDMYDSIVVQDDEAENFLDTNMYLKYIETTKSPHRLRNNGFIIPPPRNYNDMSNIFSQQVERDDLLDCYKGSFVVSDEEFVVSEDNMISPLSKAEAILRKQKRDKRKQPDIPNFKKRRRILNNIIEISDDESD